MRAPRRIPRRAFLQLSFGSLIGLALNPMPPEPDEPGALGLGRVCVPQLAVRETPLGSGPALAVLEADTVLTLFAEVSTHESPGHPERWYRVDGGFVPASAIQRVKWAFNPVAVDIAPTGLLGAVTVPYTDSFARPSGTSPFASRLYFDGVIRVLGVEKDGRGRFWYRWIDDRNGHESFVPAQHVREIPSAELRPISPEVPVQRKLIRVDISLQQLTAYEYDRVVYRTRLSAGRSAWRDNPAEPIRSLTPVGRFRLLMKRPYRTMLDADVPSVNGYARPGIPWVSYFSARGDATHGVYWHDNFGRPMSHGCLQLRPADALWVYRWSDPRQVYEKDEVLGDGTAVEIDERDSA